MTTIIAIVAAYFYYTHSVFWALALTIVAGLIQTISKSIMNQQFRSALACGYSVQVASNAISNGVTRINMVSTFTVWSLGIYALLLEFA